MYVDVLAFMRDMRWDVMAMCAENEPRSEEPVITNTAELRRSFKDPTAA